MAVHRLRPSWSERMADRLLSLVGVLFAACALLLLCLHLPLLAGIPAVAWIALAGLTGAALAVGHLLGGPVPDDRTALAVCCATRHIGVAALAAAAVPGPRTIVLLLAYLVVAAPASFLYLRWRRAAQATAAVGH
jgi:BASS family bile acid:Na+ symporter